MFDLETFGKRAGCVVRSIGAVCFDLEGGEGETFYANISTDSCTALGLTCDPETVEWWSRQNKEAQEALLVDSLSLTDVIDRFNVWFKKHGDMTIWCQGANFDEPVWAAACHAAGKNVPWKYWNVRDTRTLYDIFGFNPKTVPRPGTCHNALDDAKHQVRCLQLAYLRQLPHVVKKLTVESFL